MDKYELFCHLLIEEKMYLDPFENFKTLCRRIQVDEEVLEKRIYAELGTGGQELIDVFRSGHDAFLLHKYGEDAFR